MNSVKEFILDLYFWPGLSLDSWHTKSMTSDEDKQAQQRLGGAELTHVKTVLQRHVYAVTVIVVYCSYSTLNYFSPV